MEGAIILQGPHQVAKKSTTTSLPAESARIWVNSAWEEGEGEGKLGERRGRSGWRKRRDKWGEEEEG